MPASPRVLAVSAVSAAAVALSLGIGGAAYASGGDEDSLRTCSDFETQKDAQLALEADLLGLANLDIELGGADNGIACDKPKKDDDDGDDEDDDDKDHEKKKDSDDSDDSDDDSDDDDSDEKKDSDDSDDDQVKVKPKGGVDTGGFPVA